MVAVCSVSPDNSPRFMASLGSQDQIIVYSDVPPLGNEGVSMAVLAHRLIASLEPNVVQVITRVASRKYSRHLIGTKLQAPTLLSWECGRLWLRFLRGAARVCGRAVQDLSFALPRTILFGALGWWSARSACWADTAASTELTNTWRKPAKRCSTSP
jgi:hypothetical protein